MARLPFLHPSAVGTAVATVSLLHNLRPLGAVLRAALEDLGITGVQTLDQRLECEGRVAVFEGCPEQARGLERALRTLGLTTSLNLLSASAGSRRGIRSSA